MVNINDSKFQLEFVGGELDGKHLDFRLQDDVPRKVLFVYVDDQGVHSRTDQYEFGFRAMNDPENKYMQSDEECFYFAEQWKRRPTDGENA